MKNLVPLGLLIICISVSSAQTINKTKGIGKINGIIIDASTQKPVQFTTVSLTEISSKKLIDGVITDENGKFEIKNVPLGDFKITANFIGYKNAEYSLIEITEATPIINIGEIKIEPDTKLLKEVVVEGQKTLIEEKVDRIVYNSENDATSKGGDAADVMKKVPLLTVDLDGNVSLRGNQNIRILINNRPSTLSAGSVADALKQIPADQIKSVEVITSPSSKYDAEGSAGIININLKKNSLQGVFLNIDAGAGYRGSNLGLSGNLNRGKARFSLGGFGRYGYNIPGEFKNNQTIIGNAGPISRNEQEAKSRMEMLFGRYSIGMDYDIDEHNFISTSIQYGGRNNWNYQDGLKTKTFVNSLLQSENKRNVEVIDLSNTLDVSLNYTHTFKKPQHEFSILSLYSRNDRNNDFLNSIFDSTSTNIANELKNLNKSTNQEITVQADYTQPIGKTQILETGAKNIIRLVESDYSYLFSQGNSKNFIKAPQGNLSNVFNYNQNVTAGYVSYSLSFLKTYSLKAGGRYEYTTIDASFSEGQLTKIPSYAVWVPSVNISKRFKKGNMLKASFNRRIQRPSIQFLNPNIQNANPLSITIGNPTLNPEYTNNYELSYSTNIKKTFLNVSAFARNTTGAIQSVRELKGSDTIRTSYANIGSENAYGMNVFANINISNKLSLSGGTDAYYAVLDNNSATSAFKAHNEGFVVSGRVFGSYNLPKDWGLQLFGFYRGNQVQLQGSQSGFGFYSLSIKKDFNDKKGSIGFGAENFFYPSITIINKLNTPTLEQESRNKLYNFSFRVNFSYKLGKVSTEGRQKKSLQNDDLKEGDNGGGMMQGGGGAPSGGGGMPNGGGGRPSGGFKPNNIPKNLKSDSLAPGFKPKNLMQNPNQIKSDSIQVKPE